VKSDQGTTKPPAIPAKANAEDITASRGRHPGHLGSNPEIGCASTPLIIGDPTRVALLPERRHAFCGFLAAEHPSAPLGGLGEAILAIE